MYQMLLGNTSSLLNLPFMEFDAYLTQKKIDANRFKEGKPQQYAEWKTIFEQVHPNSFTQQKLFLINDTRRAYTLKDTSKDTEKPSKPAMRPKILPVKPKKN